MSVQPTRRRSPRDPLQVNLRWLVFSILLVVIVPTVLLTGTGIVVLLRYRESPGLIMGILVTSFSASVIAGAVLLIVLTRRGARLARIQETFMSRVSHELLTPLAGIRLHAQILEASRVTGQASDSVEAIRRETDRLQTLVEQIMSWRKYRSTRHLYPQQQTSLGAVVDEGLRRTRGSERATVRVHSPQTGILVDPGALGEAIGNLLQNALKYGPDGPVELTARRIQRMLVFTVSDRGPGLPPGPPDQIFDAFFRHVAPDRPDPGGSGLGLAIARQIVRAHGGKLVVRPRLGPGLSFIIVLPAGTVA